MADTRGIRAGRAYVELGTSDKLTAGLRRAQSRLTAFARSVRQIGQGLVKASAAAVIPLAISGKVFANFEQRMARVQALTGATGAEFDKLAVEAKRLGESTVFSASQAAEAMGFFALAGFNTSQILKSMKPTLDLAAAGQLEIAQAADIAAKIMAGMGISADELGNAVDVLTKAMTTANTDLNQLGEAMKYIGPIAKSAGIEFEEITAAIQLLSNAGIQAEMAGTTLRGAILALTSPSAEASAKLAELGVSVVNAHGNVRPLADIIEQLNNAMAGMGSGERLNVLGQIFQARQAAGVAELLSQGAQKLRDYTDALRNSGGVAARIAGVQLNTLTGDTIILKSALEGLAIAIGESIGPPLRIAVAAITRVAGAVTKWVRENRDLVVMVGAAAIAVGGLGIALLSLGVAVKVAAFAFGGLLSLALLVKAVFAGLAGVIGLVVTPLGAIVAGLATIAVGLAAYTGTIGRATAWIADAFNDLRAYIGDILQAIVDAFRAGDTQAAAKVMWAALRVEWERGAAFLKGVWFIIESTWIDFLERFSTGAVNVIADLKKAFAGLASYIVKAFNTSKRGWEAFKFNLQKGAIELERKTGLLTDEQARKAKIAAALDTAANLAAIEADSAQADAVFGALVQEIEADQAARLAELRAKAEKAQQDAGKGLVDAQSEYNAAQAELARAIAAARTSLANAPQRRAIKEFEASVQGLGDILNSRGGSIFGTFNAAALRGLRGRDPNEETARNTAGMLQIMKRRRWRGIFG